MLHITSTLRLVRIVPRNQFLKADKTPKNAKENTDYSDKLHVFKDKKVYTTVIVILRRLCLLSPLYRYLYFIKEIGAEYVRVKKLYCVYYTMTMSICT